MAEHADNAAFSGSPVNPAPAIVPPEAAIRAPVREPNRVRAIALNAVRFVSVLIGAGLLLRVGASEHAISAVDEPRPQPEKPARSRLVMPQPAFGQAANVDAGRVPSMIATDPQAATLATALAPAKPALTASRRHKAGAPSGKTLALTPGAEMVSTAEVAKLTAVAQTPVRLAETAPVGGVSVKRMSGRAAPRHRLVPAVSFADSAPSILSPSRPRPSVGLLAPVRVVSGTAAEATRTPAAPRSAPSSAPLSAQAPAPAPAPALAAVRPAPAAPAAAAPVQISLAPPVMRPGPRTTTLRSDIRDVMRRPASAWDYADGLPVELTGRLAAIPKQASAQPVGQQPALAPQPAPAQVASAKAGTRLAPQAAPGKPSLPVQAAPVAAAASTALAAPTRPVALLDLPPAPTRKRSASRKRAARGDRAAPAIAPKSGQALAPSDASGTAQASQGNGPQISSTAGSGAAARFADAAAPGSGGVSLRKRIPRPAF